MKKIAAIALSAIIVILIFSLLIYPTPYRYFQHEDFFLKENRLTGKVYVLDFRVGWEELVSTPE